MEFIVEVIGPHIEGCIIAQDAGANRIELCDNLGEGGTTASLGLIKAARQKLHIDLYPIIRPRGGDFFYTDSEFDVIKTDVTLCKDLNCNGVVTGILTQDGKVDKKRCGLLVEYAYPLEVTFHRAFDRTADPFEALEDIIEIGCQRILTSGQRSTAMQGAGLIRQLIQQADGRIIIMPGSGVRSGSIANLAIITGAVEFHTSAKINLAGKMNFQNSLMDESSESASVNGDEVRKIISELSALKVN